VYVIIYVLSVLYGVTSILSPASVVTRRSQKMDKKLPVTDCNMSANASTTTGNSAVGSTSTSTTCRTPFANYRNNQSNPSDRYAHAAYAGMPHLLLTVSRNLTGQVFKTSIHAVAGGGYSDVWHGDLNGRPVAIKAPRIVNVSVTKLAQVSRFSRRTDTSSILALLVLFHRI
jgi:hypothetical protein